MDENNADSVFKLITNLCEKFHDNPDKIKKSRSKCYEILLGKRIPKYQKPFKDLKGTIDPFCNLLSWQLVLIHDHNLRDHADSIQECAEAVQQCYEENVNDCRNVLQFLLSLRNVPTKDNTKLDLSSLPPIDEFENFNNLFKLPESIINECERHNSGTNLSTRCKALKKQISNYNPLAGLTSETQLNDFFKDDGYHSTPKTPEDIWETASKMKYSARRNWENFGYPEPDKEPPFLSELGDLSSLWVENLESLYIVKLFRDENIFNSTMKSRRIFIGDLKYLLVGMSSDSFGVDQRGEFYLLPRVTVNGITPDSLERYCSDLMFAGTCYMALHKMSIPDPHTGKYKYDGYIFAEFCESINRYLTFYRTAIFDISDTTNYLQFHEYTYQLRLQISAIASICKVGPYMESEEIPHGIALLNYLYQKVLTLTEGKVITALYSILYACCQVYFGRFLNQWILEGTINDPYGEFFIKPNSKYISTRGRTYWTRSYTLREDIVPDFLIDLRMDLLHCGKTMNLLKLCVHSSKLCLYLMGRKPSVISCCLTSEHLLALKQNTTMYYLEVCTECGPRFNLSDVLTKWHKQDPVLMSLIAKKRATTLRKLELERQKIIQEQNEKKMEEIAMLREQYDTALLEKQTRIAMEVEREMKQIEQNLDVELKRQKLIKDEANKLVMYYSELIEVAEVRKSKIENHLKKMKSIHLDQSPTQRERDKEDYLSTVESLAEKSDSSTESFYSVNEEAEQCENEEKRSDEMHSTTSTHLHSSLSMDIINANKEGEIEDENSNKKEEVKEKTKVLSKNVQQAIDNFEMARRNKQKVMEVEMNIQYCPTIERKVSKTPIVSYLTDAQQNKIRMLSSEFGIDIKPERTDRLTSVGLINRNRVMGVSDSLNLARLDNESFVNKNVRNLEETSSKIGTVKKSKSLLLDLDKLSIKSHRSESDKPIPMSVDSTPLSELPQSSITTPSTMFLSVDTNMLESIPNTADTQQTEEEFNFTQHKNEGIIPIYYNRNQSTLPRPVFSKRVTLQEAAGVSTNCLKLFLHESIQIPLMTQTELVNNELLRYFIDDLNYLQHLTSLRDYFFLQDGEFGRNITENLFEKLYDANFPVELINCRTLQDLVFGALDMSSKNQGNSNCLSFKINSLPKCFDLGDPDVLDCLSLTYKVKWPLNILLPTDTIGKYDEVFKYLLKLNRVSWALKKIFLFPLTLQYRRIAVLAESVSFEFFSQELKVLAKETGKKETYLMTSPQYRRLHQCRHIMSHFIQTLQNYVVGEVLQTSWQIFEKNLANVTKIDELYSAHTAYIKNILFMCLLNQKTIILRNVIQKNIHRDLEILRLSKIEDKLENIFKNFEEFVLYLFKVGRKVAKSGYQPYLIQLLDMLDHNAYYTESQKRYL
ncbi:hypothetical protein NQ318_016958 [Aromia moschata]|uniref:Gamma-tubulin complex component 6 n=1 Tax=Aromia moschata TaxID=1265417 RepID=A0AAV8YDU0_9CUCU|nr:hypothetical protein NQ318_016958 [Aromia moschata]